MVTPVQVIPAGVPLVFFARSGVFWLFVQNLNTGTTQAYSSPDGINWTQQNGDGFSTVGWVAVPAVGIWDGANTVTFFYQEGTFSGNTFLQQFNLSTGLWGAAFAQQSGGVPGNAVPERIHISSAGDFVVVYQDGTGFPLAYNTQVWNGAAWSAPVDVCAGAEALGGFNPAQTLFAAAVSVLDGGDVLHVVYDTFSTDPTWNNRFFYQEVTLGGVLQNFFEFPGQVPAPSDLVGLNLQPGASLIVAGNSLYLGVLRNNTGPGANPFPSIYVGTPLINPVWVERGNIDPGAVVNQQPEAQPVLQVNAGTIYASFIRANATDTSEQVQLATSTDGFASSASQTLTDSATGGPFIQTFGPLFVFSPFFAMATGYAPSEGAPVPTYFTQLGSGAFSVKITLRGVNRRRCMVADPVPDMTPMKDAPHVERAV